MNDDNLILWESAGREPIAVRVAICGDFLPAGKLAVVRDESWSDQARGLREYFADVATTFANLEATLDCDTLAPRVLNGLGQVVAAPAASLAYMEAIHACGVGIANNHSYDFGDAGVQRTRAAVARVGMTPLGAGFAMREPQEVFVWEGPGGVRVGFWAAAKAASDLATENSRGVESATAAEMLVSRMWHGECVRRVAGSSLKIKINDHFCRVVDAPAYIGGASER